MIIILELWNHGTAGEEQKPCGEIDVFNVTGEKVPAELLLQLLSDDDSGLVFEWFEDLPTEKALLVEAEINQEEGGYSLTVKSCKELCS